MKNWQAGLLAALVLAASAASAAKIKVGEEGEFEARVLLQPQAAFINEGGIDGRSLGWDVGFRRARVILNGNVNKNLSFFFETDSPNIGLSNGKGALFSAVNPGVPAQFMYVQDAMIHYKIDPAFTVDVGLMLIPFTHHALQSAASLMSLDYHATYVKYPTAAVGTTAGNTMTSTLVWRDMGVQVRGLLMENHLQYRAGVFGGLRGSTSTFAAAYGANGPAVNATQRPRIAGTVRYNLWDAEDAFFTNGYYGGKKKVLSIGVAADYQSKASFDSARMVTTDYMALGGDIFFDMPMNDAKTQELIVQVNAAQYKYGEGLAADGTTKIGSANTGLALFGEAGFRMDKVMPYVGYDMFSSYTTKADMQAIRLGCNYLMDGNTSKLIAEVAMVKNQAAGKTMDESTFQLQGRIQAQLLF